jgi:hypothetical protein
VRIRATPSTASRRRGTVGEAEHVEPEPRPARRSSGLVPASSAPGAKTPSAPASTYRGEPRHEPSSPRFPSAEPEDVGVRAFPRTPAGSGPSQPGSGGRATFRVDQRPTAVAILEVHRAVDPERVQLKVRNRRPDSVSERSRCLQVARHRRPRPAASDSRASSNAGMPCGAGGVRQRRARAANNDRGSSSRRQRNPEARSARPDPTSQALGAARTDPPGGAGRHKLIRSASSASRVRARSSSRATPVAAHARSARRSGPRRPSVSPSGCDPAGRRDGWRVRGGGPVRRAFGRGRGLCGRAPGPGNGPPRLPPARSSRRRPSNQAIGGGVRGLRTAVARGQVGGGHGGRRPPRCPPPSSPSARSSERVGEAAGAPASRRPAITSSASARRRRCCSAPSQIPGDPGRAAMPGAGPRRPGRRGTR